MTLAQELKKALERRHPDTVCLGGVCYLRLDGGNLAKAEFTSRGGSYNGLRLTVLNRRSGPVDSVTVSFWDLPRGGRKAVPDHEESIAWDIARAVPDIDALSELAEEYLCLFRKPALESR